MGGVDWQRRWDPFRELQREVGRLLESLDPFQSARRVQAYPPVNLYDAGDRYILAAQLPGLMPNEIELTITGETLTVRGERKRPEGVKDDSYRRQERPMGRWQRTLTLPDRVDSQQVAASFANGILAVSLPKAESARPRHITVTSGVESA
jgi:HSP20 family protein